MTDYPTIRLRPKGGQRLRFGAPWCYADELVLDRRSRKIVPGSIALLEDAERKPMALGAFNPNSKIAFRRLDSATGGPFDKAWFQARLKRAFDLRERLFEHPFYRLIHAEADDLPGVVIDRFGDAAVVQPNAAWADLLLSPLIEALHAVTGIETIVMNGTGRSRILEGLPEETQLLSGRLTGPVEVAMNGATYMADLLEGQKTGLFFDQRPNHAFAARLAQGARVLDVFSHVGGFSLAALAAGAESALAVDGSAPALKLAETGAQRMGVSDRFSTHKGDAFSVMTNMLGEGAAFDMVVCDPPAFAPSKSALEAGLRAYCKTARQGTGLTAPGGYLVLCSCSHAADLSRFREACLKGIYQAGRVGQIIHTGAAGPDHPVHPGLAESAYLKALFFRLD